MNRWAQLGRTGNLLCGLRARWDAQGGPLVGPAQSGLVTFAAAPPDGPPPHWQPPTVSLHEDVAGLARAAFGVRATEVDAGAVMPEREVLEYLGLTPGANRSFALVRVARVGEACVHEALARPPRRPFYREHHLTVACRRAEARLRPGPRPRVPHAKRLDAAAAQAYLDHFEQFGTHFISAIRFGDVLLQAFAFDAAEWRARLAASGFDAAERVLGGERALACWGVIAASPSHAPGRVISVAGDAAATAAFAAEPSLLAPFAREGDRALERLGGAHAQAPVEIELKPLCRFLELYRALNWERLLAGALHQRLGADVTLPDRGPREERVDDVLLRPPPGSRPDYQELLRGGEEPVLAAHTLVLRERERLTGFPLAVHTLRSEARTSAAAPQVVLADDALTGFAPVVERMEGMVRVSNRSGTQHATLLDGFLLTDAGVARAAHVAEPGTLERVAPLLPLLLRTAERLLCDEHPPAWRAAQALLDWLRRLPAPEPVRERAGELARVGPAFGLRGNDAARDEYLAGVLEAARAGEAERARRLHDAFWWEGAAAPRSGDPLTELYLLRAHALTISGRPRTIERASL